jgi:hypothetical protein
MTRRTNGTNGRPLARPEPMPDRLEIAEMDIERLELELSIAQARREAALDALASLVRYVRQVGGFMEHLDQLALRHAEALVVESGRSVER